MATSRPNRTKVFISYSHADAEWLKRLQVHLKPLEREGRIARWDDTKIHPGTRWREEIEQALAEAKVAVLLVSADFLASDFIADNELPPLLTAAAAGGTVILPVILSPSRFEQTPLAQFQAINPPSQPLISLAKAQQEAVFVQVAEAIERALGFPVGALEEPRAAPVSGSTPGSASQFAIGGNPRTGQAITTGSTHLWEKMAAFVFGVVFVTALLAIAIVFPEPTAFQYQVFRIILALACAGVAAVIPGLLDIQTNSLVGLVIQAGGALAVFVLVYLVNPAQLVAPAPDDTPEPVIEEQVLKGTVWDEDNEPLAGVQVSLPFLDRTTTTDALGRFEFQLTAPRQDPVELIAQKAGYRTHNQYATLGNEALSFTLRKTP